VAEELSSKHNSSTSFAASDPEGQQHQHDHYAQDEGSDDDLSDDEGRSSEESFGALEERFHGLEEEVAILVADVHDLALYTKLNITGFMKILKVGVFSVFMFLSHFLVFLLFSLRNTMYDFSPKFMMQLKLTFGIETDQRPAKNLLHPRIS